MHNNNNVFTSVWLPILAAAVALVVVHGFGRFVYTPLLPLLVNDGLISLPEAAAVASWNYVGYLLGAMLALFLYQRALGLASLLIMLAASALITCLQLFAQGYDSLALLRLLNGISNGVVFVLAPALVLEWLVEVGKPQLSGLMYLGVGFGILASSLLVDVSSHWSTGSWRWLTAALCSIPLVGWSIWHLRKLPNYKPNIRTEHSTRLWDRSTTPLFLGYAGAGLGYILPMTFIPAVANEWQINLFPSAWFIVALASIPSTWAWNHLGAKIGDKSALLWNYALQALSIVALLGLGGKLGLWLCALLMGGSFLGCVLLTQRIARALQPHQGPRLSAALVALYGFTQLTGPWLAKIGIENGASLASTFIIGLVALGFALVLTFGVPKTN